MPVVPVRIHPIRPGLIKFNENNIYLTKTICYKIPITLRKQPIYISNINALRAEVKDI
jgi:hypothetical protein